MVGSQPILLRRLYLYFTVSNTIVNYGRLVMTDDQNKTKTKTFKILVLCNHSVCISMYTDDAFAD